MVPAIPKIPKIKYQPKQPSNPPVNKVGDQRVGSYSRIGYQERVQYIMHF